MRLPTNFHDPGYICQETSRYDTIYWANNNLMPFETYQPPQGTRAILFKSFLERSLHYFAVNYTHKTIKLGINTHFLARILYYE